MLGLLIAAYLVACLFLEGPAATALAIVSAFVLVAMVAKAAR